MWFTTSCCVLVDENMSESSLNAWKLLIKLRILSLILAMSPTIAVRVFEIFLSYLERLKWHYQAAKTHNVFAPDCSPDQIIFPIQDFQTMLWRVTIQHYCWTAMFQANSGSHCRVHRWGSWHLLGLLRVKSTQSFFAVHRRTYSCGTYGAVCIRDIKWYCAEAFLILKLIPPCMIPSRR